MFSKINHIKKGTLAEIFAIIFLLLKGYRILKYNHKSKLGQIDIIATKSKYIIAIEVKFRKSYTPKIVTKTQLNRINLSFNNFILKKLSNYKNLTPRIDIILVKKYGLIKHIKNVS